MFSSNNNNNNNNRNSNDSDESSSSSSSAHSFELKAGMQGVDKAAIQKVIDDLTKGTPFHEHQQRKLAERDAKALKVIQRSAEYNKIPKNLQLELKQSVEEEVVEILKTAKLSRYCHVDMDAFHAAVEEIDQPHLKHVPMAVGGNSIIGTANYPARKYGCRGGMPGFVAKHLCPQLIIIPPNFDKYQAATEKTRQVAEIYDEDFYAPFGGDEFFIELSDKNLDKWRKRKQQKEFEFHELSTRKSKSAKMTNEERAVDEFLFVQDLRKEIFTKTKLSCSAGIGPTRTLAKIVSGVNKPNGQFALEARTIEDIKEYVWGNNLKTRQIPGIGPATDNLLQKLGVKTCKELFEVRARLKYLMPPKTFSFLLQASLGLTGAVPAPDKGTAKRNSKKYHQIFNTSSSGEIDDSNNNNNNNNNNNEVAAAVEPVVKSISIERTLERRITNTKEAEEVLDFLLNRAVSRLRQSVIRFQSENNDNNNINKKDANNTSDNNSNNKFSVVIQNVGIRSRLTNFESHEGSRKINPEDLTSLSSSSSSSSSKKQKQKKPQATKNIEEEKTDEIEKIPKIEFDCSSSASDSSTFENKNNEAILKVLKTKILDICSGGEKQGNNYFLTPLSDQYRLMGCKINFLWPPVPSSSLPRTAPASSSENNNTNSEQSKTNNCSDDKKPVTKLTPPPEGLFEEEDVSDMLENDNSSDRKFDENNNTIVNIKDPTSFLDYLSGEDDSIIGSNNNDNKSNSSNANNKKLPKKQQKPKKTLLVVQGPEMTAFVQRGLDALPFEEKNSYEIFEFPSSASSFKAEQMKNTDGIFMTNLNELNDLLLSVDEEQTTNSGENNSKSGKEKSATNGEETNNNDNDEEEIRKRVIVKGFRDLINRLGQNPGDKKSLQNLRHKSILLCGSSSNRESAATFQAMIVSLLNLKWPHLIELREQETHNEVEKQRQQQFLQVVAQKSMTVSPSDESSASASLPVVSSAHHETCRQNKSYIKLLDLHNVESIANAEMNATITRGQQKTRKEMESGHEKEEEEKTSTKEQEESSKEDVDDDEIEEEENNADNKKLDHKKEEKRSILPVSTSSSITSTAVSPRDCFLNLHRFAVSFVSSLREADKAALRNTIHTFSEKNRKQWLLGSSCSPPRIQKSYSSTTLAGYSLTRRYENFFNSDLKVAALGECQDVIPNAIDGLTRAQRAVVQALLLSDIHNTLLANNNSGEEFLDYDNDYNDDDENNNSKRKKNSSYTIDEVVSLTVKFLSDTNRPNFFSDAQLAKAVFDLSEVNPNTNLPLLLINNEEKTYDLVSSSTSSYNRRDLEFILSPMFRALFPREDDELLLEILSNTANNNISGIFSTTNGDKNEFIIADPSSFSATLSLPLIPTVPLILLNNNEANHALMKSTSSFAGNLSSQIPRFHPLDVSHRVLSYIAYQQRRRNDKLPEETKLNKPWYRGVDDDHHVEEVPGFSHHHHHHQLPHHRQQGTGVEMHHKDVAATTLIESPTYRKRTFNQPFVCIQRDARKVCVESDVDHFFRRHFRARNDFYKQRRVLRMARLEQEIAMAENSYRFCSAAGRNTLKFSSVQKGEEGLIDFFEQFGYERVIPLKRAAIVGSGGHQQQNKRQFKQQYHHQKRSFSRNPKRRQGYEYLLETEPSAFTENALKESWVKLQDMKNAHRELSASQSSSSTLKAHSENIFKTDVEVFCMSVLHHLNEEREKQKEALEKLEMSKQSLAAENKENKKAAKKLFAGSKDSMTLRREEIAERIRRENVELIRRQTADLKRNINADNKNDPKKHLTQEEILEDEEYSFREQKMKFLKAMSRDDRKRAIKHDDEQYEYDHDPDGEDAEVGEGGADNNTNSSVDENQRQHEYEIVERESKTPKKGLISHHQTQASGSNNNKKTTGKSTVKASLLSTATTVTTVKKMVTNQEMQLMTMMVVGTHQRRNIADCCNVIRISPSRRQMLDRFILRSGCFARWFILRFALQRRIMI